MSFEKLYKALLVILPFHVLITVFFQYKIGIPGFGLYKELLVLWLLAVLVYEYYKLKKIPKFDILDHVIFAYVGYLLLITLVNFSGLKAFIYGGRYDFEFLLIFMITRHGRFLLKDKLSNYLKIFLISGGAALIIGCLVRFVFGEAVLIHVGFSSKISTWSFNQGVPIYHGIEGANVRRFQGIFDGPNQAAFFLIIYSGLLFHYLRNKKDYQFYLLCALVIIGGLIFFTYSRSSILGVIVGLLAVFVMNLKTVIKKYKVQSAGVALLLIVIGGAFYVRYGGRMESILLREGSSKGHSERMIIGLKQFVSHPLGQGLASSGPGYRMTHDTTGIDEKNFIPESWYVQQLVEGGVIGFVLFVAIICILAYQIYFLSIPFFFSFIAILFMNLLLHTFEASYVSLILFMFLGLFLKNKSIKTPKS